MKSEVKPVEKKSDKPFPKLMKSKSIDAIVLFQSEDRGVCVSAGRSTYTIGYYSSIWNMSNFTDFEGTVTLSND